MHFFIIISLTIIFLFYDFSRVHVFLTITYFIVNLFSLVYAYIPYLIYF